MENNGHYRQTFDLENEKEIPRKNLLKVAIVKFQNLVEKYCNVWKIEFIAATCQEKEFVLKGVIVMANASTIGTEYHQKISWIVHHTLACVAGGQKRARQRGKTACCVWLCF